MADDTNTYSFNKTLGIITAWDTISFGDNANIGENKNPVPRSRTKFTVDDIYMMLRRLKHFIDPKNIEKLERMVATHVADKNNPHGVSIEQLSSSIMGELYKDWLDYMNRTNYNSQYSEDELKKLLSTEQFLKVLFQQITIADVDTALAGESTYQVTSAKDVHEMLDAHDKDLNAHNVLMERLFPGAVHSYPPTFAMMADVGSNEELTVVRSGTLSYIGPDGRTHLAPANTLPVDYSTGVPAYPIFGSTTNYCTHGSVLTNNVFTKVNVTVTEDTSGTPSILESNKTFLVKHTNTSGATVHKLSYSIPAGTLTGHKIACISIFAKTGSLDNIGIHAYQGTNNLYNVYRYNLSNQTTWANTEIDKKIYARINDLPNGYSRCTYICPITTNSAMNVDIYLLDILDGDLTINGDTRNYLYLNGLQIEFDTDTPSTYKSTTGSTVTELATTVSYKVSTSIPWYNPFQGGVVVEATGIEKIETLQAARYLFDFTFGNYSTSALSLYSPAVHGGMVAGYFANNQGTLIYTHMFPAVGGGYQKYGLGFASKGHLQPVIGEEINTDVDNTTYSLGSKGDTFIKEFSTAGSDVATSIDTLYIGCKGNGSLYLNGYIKQLIYYPTFITPKHFTYFIEG